jgi:hypothetical protein
MTDNELRALRHAAQGEVLFHNGLWGGPAGYLWAAPDGSEAGHLPQWESEALQLLERRRLVTVRRAVGARELAVVATTAGLDALSAVDYTPAAA